MFFNTTLPVCTVFHFLFCFYFLFFFFTATCSTPVCCPAGSSARRQAGEEMGQGEGGWWENVDPQAGGHPGESYRANGDWNSQGDVGEDPEKRKAQNRPSPALGEQCPDIAGSHKHFCAIWEAVTALGLSEGSSFMRKLEFSKCFPNLGWARGFELPVPRPPVSLQGQAHDSDQS